MQTQNWKIDMSKESSRHMGDDEIESYSRGKGSQAQNEAWEEHLLLCGACLDRLEEQESTVQVIRAALLEDGQRAREEPESASPAAILDRPRWNFRWLVPAFGVVAAAALIVTLWMGWGRLAPSNLAPAAVSLRAMRGSDLTAAAPAGQVLAVRLDATDIPDGSGYRVEIVGASGAQAWTGFGAVQNAQSFFQVPAQRAGSYYVRLYSSSGDLLREYALRVESRN